MAQTVPNLHWMAFPLRCGVSFDQLWINTNPGPTLFWWPTLSVGTTLNIFFFKKVPLGFLFILFYFIFLKDVENLFFFFFHALINCEIATLFY